VNDSAHNSAQPTRVDFYLLQGTNYQSIQQFCCRLAEKAWKLGNTVFVRTENEQQTQLLDNLMWTYSDGSFLPHAQESDTRNSETPIVIGSKTEPGHSFDLMINLASDIPHQSNHYSRIAEIVNEDETIKTQGRLRYAQYDKNNHPLNHHNINA
jgi:DNA polymerase-3 subunit chi